MKKSKLAVISIGQSLRGDDAAGLMAVHKLDPHQIPHHLIIIGIEGDNFDVGASLSPAVKLAIPKVTGLIEDQVNNLYQFREK